MSLQDSSEKTENNRSTTPAADHPPESSSRKPTLGFWGTVKSSLYAMLGVQSRAEMEKSLERGRLSTFIFVGLLLVLLFILAVLTVVNLVV